jgi:hypothetical protein
VVFDPHSDGADIGYRGGLPALREENIVPGAPCSGVWSLPKEGNVQTSWLEGDVVTEAVLAS